MRDDPDLPEIHELTRRAFLEANADLVAPFIGERELAIAAGEVREETRDEWQARFAGLLATSAFERWEDREPPRWGLSRDGTMAWLIEVVDAGGERAGAPFEFRSARLTVFERDANGWRRVVNAMTVAPTR